MAQQQFANKASSRLASSITSGDTTATLVAGGGAAFPTLSGGDYFIADIVSSSTREIVKVTARSTDTLTIVRAQEGTTAVAFAAGDTVEIRITKGFLNAISALLVNAALGAIAALTPAANKMLYFTSGSAAALTDLTSTARSLLDDSSTSAMRTTLGVAIGTDVQGYDAELAALAGLTSAANKGIQFTGSGTAATYDLTTAGKALLDDADAAAQRATLGLVVPYPVAISDETTALTTGTAKVTFRIPFACTMTQLPRANVNTVSSSGLPTFDIKKNGTTIFSTTLTIDAGEKTSVTAATPAVLSGGSTTFADDDEVTIDISTAGTGTKGAKITLYLIQT